MLQCGKQLFVFIHVYNTVFAYSIKKITIIFSCEKSKIFMVGVAN